MDWLLFFIAILLIVIGVASLVDWWRERHQQSSVLETLVTVKSQAWNWYQRRRQRSQAVRLNSPQLSHNPKATDQRPPHSRVGRSRLTDLNYRLLRLLHGDGATAQRLLEYTREQHPNRDLIWYYEKVLQDLERDQRQL